MQKQFSEQQFQSQKLIRCKVVNKENSTSTRYIEIEHYKMWSYMMLHKHGLHIKESTLWLWVKEKSFLENEGIFSRAASIENVDKIELILFDEINGFSHTVTRYSAKKDSDMLEKILLGHISPELYSHDNYNVSIQNGFCVKNSKSISKLVLGLSDGDDRIWYREN